MDNLFSKKELNEQIATKLFKLSEHITVEDRKLACKKLNINMAMVSRYLNNQVGNNMKGVEILNFFSKIITERQKVATKVIKNANANF